ncbi:MAG TPA: endolytic transglycosylase MltG [Candidatus Atribacteria bacterium]|nr:endolytic transglycosylase MltG [Candidatus Atribacteria bacterium]
MKFKFILCLSLSWILCLFLALAFYYEGEKGEGKIVVIESGLSGREISCVLEKEGIVPSSLFRLFLFLSHQDKLIAGNYFFYPGESVKEVVKKLTQGPDYEKVTFPEGFTSEEMAKVLEEKGICSAGDYLDFINKPELFSASWLEGVISLEGFLFPDTYYFSPFTSPQKVIETQLHHFEEVFLPHYQTSHSFLSLKEVVILASIVEKEAKWKEEKPVVASVFINRLKQGIKLQSCATVVYALYREKGLRVENVTEEDLKVVSPFNTYLVSGLPPQAICNPGLDSLLSVLNPPATDYLYFVLQDDGKHAFSRTYEEHLHHKEDNNP